MRHLGSVVLTALLLGVPRALDARAFGSERSVYIDVVPMAPELTDFAAALERAIGGAAYSLASRPSEATLVVELLGVSSSRDTDGSPMEAASFVVGEGGRRRPVVLHYAPSQRAGAARALLEGLSSHHA